MSLVYLVKATRKPFLTYEGMRHECIHHVKEMYEDSRDLDKAGLLATGVSYVVVHSSARDAVDALKVGGSIHKVAHIEYQAGGY